jgi:hypothetical protein
MDENWKKFAYKMGYVFAEVVALCLMLAVIALLVKFLFWLF